MADITLTGNLGNDAELSFLPSGKAKLEFSVGDTPRRLNRDTNQWEDAGETTWWRVTEWGDKAEALVDPLRKGVKVLVIGTAGVRTYEKKDGTAWFSAEIKPRTIAVVPKTNQNGRQQGGFGDQQPAYGGSAQNPHMMPAPNPGGGFGGQQQPRQWGGQQQAPADDPWAAPASGDVPF